MRSTFSRPVSLSSSYFTLEPAGRASAPPAAAALRVGWSSPGVPPPPSCGPPSGQAGTGGGRRGEQGAGGGPRRPHAPPRSVVGRPARRSCQPTVVVAPAAAGGGGTRRLTARDLDHAIHDLGRLVAQLQIVPRVPEPPRPRPHRVRRGHPPRRAQEMRRAFCCRNNLRSPSCPGAGLGGRGGREWGSRHPSGIAHHGEGSRGAARPSCSRTGGNCATSPAR